ncbi:MAG: tetratricopeptide repeat protein [Nitrospinaceae bacterium]
MNLRAWLLNFILALSLAAPTSPVAADEALDWYLKGNELSREGRFDAAVDAYMESIQINPDATGPFYNLGLAFKNLKKFSRAEAAFQSALRLEPDNLNIRLSLGNLYNRLEKWEEAIAQLNLVVHRDPENAEARGNLGWALLNYDQGPPFKYLVLINLEKAVELFEGQDMKEAAAATRQTLQEARQKFGYDSSQP